jgi:predicted metal-dependent phosphoesterase TrpH
MKVDLHMHSTFSDGEDTPEALAGKVHASGIEVAALTDHDSFEGVARFRVACRALGVRTIAGMELEVEWQSQEIHILGLGFDIHSGVMADLLADMKRSRRKRTEAILANLRRHGCHVLIEAAMKYSETDTVRRSHIARAMVDCGDVATRQEAVEKWLIRGCPGYLPKTLVDSAVGIDAIRRAGGVAVFAHPFKRHPDMDSLEKVVPDLIAMGLGGLEVVYSGCSPAQVENLIELARNSGLVITVGSDFHGDSTGDCRLGDLPSIEMPTCIACMTD